MITSPLVAITKSSVHPDWMKPFLNAPPRPKGRSSAMQSTVRPSIRGTEK